MARVLGAGRHTHDSRLTKDSRVSPRESPRSLLTTATPVQRHQKNLSHIWAPMHYDLVSTGDRYGNAPIRSPRSLAAPTPTTQPAADEIGFLAKESKPVQQRCVGLACSGMVQEATHVGHRPHRVMLPAGHVRLEQSTERLIIHSSGLIQR